uniref:Uncharacterized protein n=1 Tax=Anguilla anguilla TaxID=7936 RepID=A0A0E9SL07_ANGAN
MKENIKTRMQRAKYNTFQLQIYLEWAYCIVKRTPKCW